MDFYFFFVFQIVFQYSENSVSNTPWTSGLANSTWGIMVGCGGSTWAMPTFCLGASGPPWCFRPA